ncbi:MAG: hypothetical protein ACREQO_12365 [Candidatus Binatia bacterium]
MAKPPTQEFFGKVVGVTQQEVARLVAKGVLTRGANLNQWLLEYTQNLREQAAQHRSEDGIDRVKEAALLDRRRREQIELDLARERGNLISRAEIGAFIGFAFMAVRGKLLSFPSWLRSVIPQLTPRQIDSVDNKIREILAELGNERASPAIREITEQFFRDLHAAAETNGERVGGSVPVSKSGEQR